MNLIGLFYESEEIFSSIIYKNHITCVESDDGQVLG